jgi:hypothetical protein
MGNTKSKTVELIIKSVTELINPGMKTVVPIIGTSTGTELRIINIRTDLKPIEQKYVSTEAELKYFTDPKRLIPNQTSGWESTKEYKATVLAHFKNIEINCRASGSLFDAFLLAYNNHLDVTLVPDDVWLTIMFQFSKYINRNAEKMRNKFVAFEGKQKLTVVTNNDGEEYEWEEFFNLMIEKIKKNTKGDIVSEMHCDFSTTGLVEKMISVATVMDSFKNYFEYGRCIPMCGIKSVRFAGTLDDWKSILSRLQFLDKYDIDGKWTKYISNLIPIISQFIETYQGNVDTVFWDKVMNIKLGSLGSGGPSKKVSGWILAFYNQNGEIDRGSVDCKCIIDIPVELDNHRTGVVKVVRLRGTFGGINLTDGSYRPQLSMVVCELESDNLTEEEKEKIKKEEEENKLIRLKKIESNRKKRMGILS